MGQKIVERQDNAAAADDPKIRSYIECVVVGQECDAFSARQPVLLEERRKHVGEAINVLIGICSSFEFDKGFAGTEGCPFPKCVVERHDGLYHAVEYTMGGIRKANRCKKYVLRRLGGFLDKIEDMFYPFYKTGSLGTATRREAAAPKEEKKNG